MNLNPKTLQKIIDMVNRWNSIEEHNTQYQIEFKDFWTPVEECVRSDAMRPNPVGETVIRSTWRKYRNFIINECIKDMLYKSPIIEPELRSCIIVDVDATLSFNISGRPFYGEGADELMHMDIPNKPVVDIVTRYVGNSDIDVIIVTGRYESSREITHKWLYDNGIYYDKLLMRADDDRTKGELYKKNVYETQIRPEYNVLFVLEDSQRCVDMYRSLGLTVLQPNEGKF